MAFNHVWVLSVLVLSACTPTAAKLDSSMTPDGRVLSLSEEASMKLMKAAMKAIVERHRLSEDSIELLSQAQMHLVSADDVLWSFKFFDRVNTSIYLVYLDKMGQEVDGESLMAAENAHRHALWGPFTENCFQSIQQMQFDEVLEFIVWPLMPDSLPDFREMSEPYRAKREFVDSARKDMLATMREAFPHREIHPLPGTFAVSVALDKLEVEELSRFPMIGVIELGAEGWLLATPSVQTIRADAVHQISVGGLNANGVKLGVIEFGHWYHNPAVFPDVTVLRNGSRTSVVADEHLMGVVSIISNRSPPTASGVAPESSIFYAGAEDLAGVATASQIEATDLLLQQNVSATNFSFYESQRGSNGLPTSKPLPLGRYLDEQAHDLGATFIAGAGNHGNHPSPQWQVVASPANGLNVIAVGMFRDFRDGNWSNDTLSPASSWRNPEGLFGDRHKPDLLAPGDDVAVYSSYSNPKREWGSGTSFAVPHVVGLAGLMREADVRQSFAVEGLRATLLVSSHRDLDGRSAWLSEKDGAGAIDADVAVHVVRNRQFGTQRVSVCPALGSRTVVSIRPNLTAGKRARFALVFSSRPPEIGSEHYVPRSDFDLIVGSWNGRDVAAAASSGSIDGNTELVEFVPQVSGRHAVVLYTHRCQSEPTYVGYAWWQEP